VNPVPSVRSVHESVHELVSRRMTMKKLTDYAACAG
jgi:hypothetical protein